MSNVLIGIIGVILFIGLSIAGASYVGQLVTDGTTQKNAAIIIGSGQQTATAVRLYRIRKGVAVTPALTSVDAMITADILKARPTNPLVAANYPMLVDANGNLGGTPGYVLMYLGQSEQARDACIEIEIQNGHTDRNETSQMETTINFLSHASTTKPGCHRNNGAFGGNGGASGDYLAYFPT